MNWADEFRATCPTSGLVRTLATLVLELKLDPPSCPQDPAIWKMFLDNPATPDVQAFQLEGSSPRQLTALNHLLKRKENEKAGGHLFRTEMAAAKNPGPRPGFRKPSFERT
jgi:hypothetical protein